MDRRYARPNRDVISPDDPEWEAKAIASVNRQIEKNELREQT